MMHTFWIQIFIGTVVILHSCSCEKRLIEYTAPWQPVAIPASATPQLISIGNFDATNKAQIAQIAHHNAQILRQIKGLHPPVTQYMNPFPVFSSANSPKNIAIAASALPSQQSNHVIFPSSGSIQQSPIVKPSSYDKFPTTQNLISSSSNVAQTVMPQTVMKLGNKSQFIGNGKPEYSQLKYFNNITPSSKNPPFYMNAASSSSMPGLQHMFSTTSRVPHFRDVTLSSPSSIFKSAQLSHNVPPKYNGPMTLTSGSRPTSSNQMPGQIISSFTHFGPAAPQMIRNEPKQRIRANFLTAPFDHYHFGNSYSGHLTAGGHFVAKNHYPNSLYFPHNSLGTYQLTNTFISGPQKPNSQPFNQGGQQQPQPPLPDMQPSYLPSLPTVPPSVLSPFFQVNSGKQQESIASPTPSAHEYHHHHNGNFHLLNDEYTINLVPPPPYKDSTRFRPRQPIPTTPSTPSATVVTTNSTPIGPPLGDFFDDEQQKAMDILNKYNIPAISPLQDANRFSYNSEPFAQSTTTQSSPFNSGLNDFNQPFSTFKRRPVSTATTPFFPTFGSSTSLNNAITHSFFTIEDAITISPHLHYRRPVKPTNTNEIEASIRRPFNDIYTETTSIDTFNDFERELDSTVEPTVTIPPPPSSSSFRPRNKLRRKRPRLTTTTTTTTTESSVTYESNRNQNKLEFDDVTNEEVTELPKNHKELYTVTRDRGQFNIQFNRETTTPEPQRESSTIVYRFNNNRTRNRTRINNISIETSSSSPIGQRKRPIYNNENRRPNNRFEDNKVQRQRPQTEKSTRTPHDETEQTTVPQRDFFSRPSRRPFTTQQAIATTLQEGNESQVAENDDFYSELKPTNRIRNSSPASISTTSILAPVNDNVIVDTTHGKTEENPVVLSTKLSIANESIISTNLSESNEEEEEENKTAPPEREINEEVTHPARSSSTASTSTTSTLSILDKTKANKEGMITSDGPVYIRDEGKVETGNFRNRQRMRNKEKILEAVAAATSSQTKSVIKDRGQSFVHHNEVNDVENDSSSTEKDSRLKVRLPVYKNGNKLANSGEQIQPNNVNKTTRLNGINKFDPKNRPRFSIKEYRQRMSTTVTPLSDSSATHNLVSTTASYTRLRFPTRQRILPSDLKNKTQETNKVETEKPNIVYPEKPTVEPVSSLSITSSTEAPFSETTRKRFVPKDRYSSRLKTTTDSAPESQTVTSIAPPVTVTTPKPALRRGSGTRRDSYLNRTRLSSSSTTDNPSEVSTVSRIPIIRNGSIPMRRPQVPNLRQRIQNQKRNTTLPPTAISDSLNDLAVEGSSEEKVRLNSNEVVPSSTEEPKLTTETRQTAIMKIAKDDHSYRPYKEKPTTEKPNASSIGYTSENDLNDSPSEQSERVAELTIFGSNKFNSVNTGGASRRVPGYFTLATEDPILPIEAFFPQVKRNK